MEKVSSDTRLELHQSSTKKPNSPGAISQGLVTGATPQGLTLDILCLIHCAQQTPPKELSVSFRKTR
jgi:hypothetical protein